MEVTPCGWLTGGAPGRRCARPRRKLLYSWNLERHTPAATVWRAKATARAEAVDVVAAVDAGAGVGHAAQHLDELVVAVIWENGTTAVSMSVAQSLISIPSGGRRGAHRRKYMCVKATVF